MNQKIEALLELANRTAAARGKPKVFWWNQINWSSTIYHCLICRQDIPAAAIEKHGNEHLESISAFL